MYIVALDVGTKLWTFQPAEFTKHVKSQLTVLQVKGVDGFSCKAFRAGKATALAAAGSNLGEFLAVGEWRSISFARYFHEESVDPNRLLAVYFEMSDNEADEEVK